MYTTKKKIVPSQPVYTMGNCRLASIAGRRMHRTAFGFRTRRKRKFVSIPPFSAITKRFIEQPFLSLSFTVNKYQNMPALQPRNKSG
jgi:hypothetical protein